jgi:hypothetical protein
MSALYVKRNVPIDDTMWTPISSPIMTHFAVVKNGGTSMVRIRTDADDAMTEDTLPPSGQEVVSLAPSALLRPGVPFLYARVAAGVGGPLIVTASAA